MESETQRDEIYEKILIYCKILCKIVLGYELLIFDFHPKWK